ncbi:hypothetical protein RRG08_054962 [Elysia crispata]|uniref:Uncharacterized protein n=1 Tax=Elysia crispata TaxID=231223 RepID=A0AAE1ATG1_9GAST|nr:hypothetical protein RRG08_054962 [Elysia crispata]
MYELIAKFHNPGKNKDRVREDIYRKLVSSYHYRSRGRIQGIRDISVEMGEASGRGDRGLSGEICAEVSRCRSTEQGLMRRWCQVLG